MRCLRDCTTFAEALGIYAVATPVQMMHYVWSVGQYAHLKISACAYPERDICVREAENQSISGVWLRRRKRHRHTAIKLMDSILSAEVVRLKHSSTRLYSSRGLRALVLRL